MCSCVPFERLHGADLGRGTICFADAAGGSCAAELQVSRSHVMGHGVEDAAVRVYDAYRFHDCVIFRDSDRQMRNGVPICSPTDHMRQG